MTAQPYLYWNSKNDLIQPNADGIYLGATRCSVNNWVNDSNSTFQIAFYVSNSCIMAYGLYRTYKVKKTSNRISTSAQAFDRKTFIALGVAICADVITSMLIATWKSQKLTVAELDAINDGNNYLWPFQDIFQFFEDGMTVRIGHSIGSKDYVTAGLLIRLGAFGGFICGLFGAIFSLIIMYINPIFSFFVPTTTISILPKNCSVIPSVNDLQSLAKPYWILASFAWIAIFINKSSIGFFIGSGETQFWAFGVIISASATVLLWFVLINYLAHTLAYGLVILLPPIIFAIITFICFSRKRIYTLYQLFGIRNMFDKTGFSISYQAAKDGATLLLKDLILTIQKSMSLIMAAHIGLGSQYQLLLYNTIESVYGYSYGSQNNGSIFPIVLGYGMRLAGSRFLGEKNYEAFKWLARSYFIGANLFGMVAFITIVVFRQSVPYNYVSSTICRFNEFECSQSVYNEVFEDIDIGIIICGLMCWFNSVFNVLQATLYATMDFKFVRNCTAFCFCFIFLPSSLVSYFGYQSVIGLLISMNLPILALIGMYTHRLFFVILPDIDREKHIDWKDESTTATSETNYNDYYKLNLFTYGETKIC